MSFRITYRTELYLSLVGKKCRFFVPALGNIFKYDRRSGRKFANLKPCRFSNLQNWIFFHDSCTDFTAVYTVSRLEKMVSDALEN